jgi:hypothetical protein
MGRVLLAIMVLDNVFLVIHVLICKAWVMYGVVDDQMKTYCCFRAWTGLASIAKVPFRMVARNHTYIGG